MEESSESYLTDNTLDRSLHECPEEEFDQLVDAFFPSSSPAKDQPGEEIPQSVHELSPVTAVQHAETLASPQLTADDAVSDQSSRTDAASALATVHGPVTQVTNNNIATGDLQPNTKEEEAYTEDREEQIAAARTLLDIKSATSSPLLSSSRRRAREDSSPSLTPSEAEVGITHTAGQVTEDMALTQDASASIATFLPHHSSTVPEANNMISPLRGERTDSPIQADESGAKFAELLEAADYLASDEDDVIGSERLIDEVMQPVETPSVPQQREMALDHLTSKRTTPKPPSRRWKIELESLKETAGLGVGRGRASRSKSHATRSKSHVARADRVKSRARRKSTGT